MEGLSNSDVALLANRDRDGIFGGGLYDVVPGDSAFDWWRKRFLR